MTTTDPWSVNGEILNQNTQLATENLTTASENNKEGFEDDFSSQHLEISNRKTPLPDSQQYLESLEKKLLKIKRDPNILSQLSERRDECLRNLLNESLNLDRDGDLALDAPLTIGDSSAVQEIVRHIRPVQPLSVGETLHIVQHDQLDEQKVSSDEGSTSTPTSTEDSSSEAASH